MQVEIAETQKKTDIEQIRRIVSLSQDGRELPQLIYHMGLVFHWELLGSGFQPLPLLYEWIILPSGAFLTGLWLCSEIHQLICLVSALAGIFRAWVLLLGSSWASVPKFPYNLTCGFHSQTLVPGEDFSRGTYQLTGMLGSHPVGSTLQQP